MEARLWAELHGFTYFETSANNGLGVTDMFQVRTHLVVADIPPTTDTILCQSSLLLVIPVSFQGFFSQIVKLAESGLATKTSKQGKKPVRLFISYIIKGIIEHLSTL